MISSFFHNIGQAIATTALLVASVFGYSAEPIQQLGSVTNLPTPVAFFETTLASRIVSTDTTFTLSSATTKDGGTLATGTYAFVIDEGTSLEEIVAADCAGTSCTNATRGLSALSGTTSVAALKKEHRRGATVKITDAPLLLRTYSILNGAAPFPNKLQYASSFASSSITSGNDIANKDYVDYKDAFDVQLAGTQTIIGSKTFTSQPTVPTPTASTSAATKGYVDTVAVSGAADASTSTKGLVQEATGAQVTSRSATGTTGARLFVNPSTLASTTGLISSVSTFASSSAAATTSLFSITSTSTTQRIMVWLKGGYQSGGGSGQVYLRYATSGGWTTKDFSQMTPSTGSTETALSLFYSEIPTATGTIYFISPANAINNLSAMLQIIN